MSYTRKLSIPACSTNRNGTGANSPPGTAWVGLRARIDGDLVGFANVLWDCITHAWIQDVMVAETARHRGAGVELVHISRDGAKEAGCEWLHVDFDDHLRRFYFEACGFDPSNAGLMQLS